MEHILDNPIWNALNSGNSNISIGNEKAKKFIKEIASFGGMRDNTESDFISLYELAEVGAPVILFATGELTIPAGWKILVDKELLQMVYLLERPPLAEDPELVSLGEKDIPAMLDLTAKTKPGPFLSRTIDFGHYEGIFDGEHLVSMAGQRLHADPYMEISAVCTDPDYLGKGYAGRLILSMARRIIAASKIPFLHVLPENYGAIGLYEKLGFRTRKLMRFYVLEKEQI